MKSVAKSKEMKFIVGKTYSRPQVYEMVTGVAVKRTTGTWNKGWVIHHGQGFVFANVGVPGQGGYDYANEWVGSHLVWETTKSAARHHKNVEPLIAPGGRSHIFTPSLLMPPIAPLAAYRCLEIMRC